MRPPSFSPLKDLRLCGRLPGEGTVVAVADLMTFVCRNPEHQRPCVPISNPVTLNGTEWSFCPCGAATDHTWERIQPTGVEALRHGLAPLATHAVASLPRPPTQA
jgi:hypothetical protein